MFLNELKIMLEHGGFILWGLIALSLSVYMMLAVTWLGLIRVRRQIKAHRQELAEVDDIKRLERKFAMFELDELAWVQRRIPFIAVLSSVAPLLGLLGTVAGMLVMFSGLATSSQAQPIDKISAGISQALVTTQAGLLIAIPAAFLLAVLRKKTSETHDYLQQGLHMGLVEMKVKNS